MQKNRIISLFQSLLVITIGVGFVLLINGCVSFKTSLNSGIEEIRPGVLSGYLEFKEKGSIALMLDKEISKKNLMKKDSARWKQAQSDAVLYFPEALEAFSNIEGVTISEDETPNLYILLRRTMA